MTDLDERFRTLDRLNPPDLWADIARREPRDMPEAPRGRRILAAVAALAVAGAGVTVAAVAFLGGEPRRAPDRPTSTPIEPTVEQVGFFRWANSIAYGDGSVWISVTANDGTSAGTIVRLDAETGQEEARIAVPTIPTWEIGGGGMEIGEGSLWIAGGSDEALVVRIDTATNRVVQQIPLGQHFAADVAVDGTGVWVSVFRNDGGMEVVRIEPNTGRVVDTIPLESSYARDVVAVEGSIWVHELQTQGSVVGNSVLSRIDPESNTVVFSRPLHASALTLPEADGFIWASTGTEGGGTILRLDPRTNEITNVPSEDFALLADFGEPGFWGVANDPRTGPKPQLIRLVPETGAVEVRVALPGDASEPVALAVTDGSVWVVHYRGEITRVDLD